MASGTIKNSLHEVHTVKQDEVVFSWLITIRIRMAWRGLRIYVPEIPFLLDRKLLSAWGRAAVIRIV